MTSSSESDSINNALRVIHPYLDHGTWVFDDQGVGLVKEPFVAGIPNIIEAAVGPDCRSFTAVFSDRSFPGATFSLTRDTPEAGGYWYTLEGSKLRGWLCPATLQYFPSFRKSFTSR